MNALLSRTNFESPTGRLMRRIRRRYNQQSVNVIAWQSIHPYGSVLTNGSGLRHAPAEFERQVDYLAANFNLLSLRALLARLEEGRDLHRAAVLTFDGGHADNLTFAWPILFRRRIPMTLFPPTAVLGNCDLLWRHKLAWLDAHGCAPQVYDALVAEGWPPPRDHWSLEQYARRCFRPELNDILESILRSQAVSGPELAARMRPYLAPEDLARVDPDLVEIGNHAHTQPVLAALDELRQCHEIITARDHLHAITRRPPLAFAYPFGLKDHYNSMTEAIVRRTGHRAALDLRQRSNAAGTDPFHLSRKPPAQGRQSDFEKQVEDWPNSLFAIRHSPFNS